MPKVENIKAAPNNPQRRLLSYQGGVGIVGSAGGRSAGALGTEARISDCFGCDSADGRVSTWTFAESGSEDFRDA